MELSLEAWGFSDKFTIENNSVYVQVVQHDIPIVKITFVDVSDTGYTKHLWN